MCIRRKNCCPQPQVCWWYLVLVVAGQKCYTKTTIFALFNSVRKSFQMGPKNEMKPLLHPFRSDGFKMRKIRGQSVVDFLYVPNSDLGVCIEAISCQTSSTGSYRQNACEALPSGYSPPAIYILFWPLTTKPCLLKRFIVEV